MDNFIRVFLLDKKRDIETYHIYAQKNCKAIWIKKDKLSVVNSLLSSKRIQETDKLEAFKIIGVKA